MMRVAVMVVAFSALVTSAWAAGDGGAGHRRGRALFEQAEAKFNVGRFDEALVDYLAAYDAEPQPAFLFNIGQCYRNMGNYERAQFFFRRYTALDPRSPNRPAAERLVTEMARLAAERPADGERERPPTPPPSPPPTLVAPAPAPITAAEQPTGASPTASVAVRTGNDPAPARPVHHRAWFWVAVSAVVVVGGVATAFAVSQDDPRSSLRPIDTR